MWSSVAVVVPAAFLAGALMCLAAPAARPTTLSVLSFGAAADGVTDDAEVPEFSVQQLVFFASRMYGV